MSRIEQRIMEAQKLGFKRIVIPDFSGSGLDLKRFKIEVASVKKVEEAFRLLFG